MSALAAVRSSRGPACSSSSPTGVMLCCLHCPYLRLRFFFSGPFGVSFSRDGIHYPVSAIPVRLHFVWHLRHRCGLYSLASYTLASLFGRTLGPLNRRASVLNSGGIHAPRRPRFLGCRGRRNLYRLPLACTSGEQVEADEHEHESEHH